ncbi:hypothetical protein VTK26DRAFT_7718 [Humicola hyalothermophila]
MSFSAGPFHILSYGTLLGTTFFQTAVNGIVAFKVLPRPQFAALMARVFPIYFAMQTVLPLVTALTYPAGASAFGPDGGLGGVAGVLHPANRWGVLAPLASAALCALANLAVVGPATTKVMDARRQQEKKDGKKSYDAPPHSQEMLALNKQFSMLHGISSLLNLSTFIATVAYGVTLGHRLA